MQLVPPEFRSAQIPCRHIPFDASGETLDSLYRCDDQNEIEEVVGTWLRATIQRLEEERAAARRVLSQQPTRAVPAQMIVSGNGGHNGFNSPSGYSKETRFTFRDASSGFPGTGPNRD